MKKLSLFLFLIIFLSFKNCTPMCTFSEDPSEIADEFGPLIRNLYEKIYNFFHNPNLMLIDAVIKNDICLFKRALRLGADINFKHVNNNTPMHFAALNNSLDVLKLLLNNGAISDSVNKIGNTPLHVASYKEKRILKFLLKFYKSNGMDIDCVNLNGSTPLHLAVFSGNSKNTAILIDDGVDINMQDNDGYTVLHTAIIYARKSKLNKLKQKSFLEIIKQLIIAGAKEKIMDNSGNKPNYYIRSDRSILTIIKEARLERSKIRNHARRNLDLRKMSGQGLKEVFRQSTLQKTGREIGESKVVILQKYLRRYLARKNPDLIIESGQANLYNGIIQNRIKCNTHYRRYGRITIEKVARRIRAKERRKKEREKRKKAAEKRKKRAKKLKKKKKECLNKFIEILKENEIEVSLSSFEDLFKFKDEDGNTILHIFIMCEEVEWLRFILNIKRLNLNIRNMHGETPLHCAIYTSNLKIVELLLDLGVNSNIQDKAGNTALHLAVWSPNTGILDMLLKYGDTNIKLKNEQGFSALDYVGLASSEKVVSIMTKYGDFC